MSVKPESQDVKDPTTTLTQKLDTLITLNDKGNIRTKYSAPTYSGEGDFSLEDWFESLEAHFNSSGTWTDRQKIDEARNCVDYSKGPARAVLKHESSKTYEDFKRHMRSYTGTEPTNDTTELFNFFSCRWKKSETFVDFTNRLFSLFKQVSQQVGAAESRLTYYKYMEVIVIKSLPTAAQQRRERKPFTVKDKPTWDDFLLKANEDLKKEQGYRPFMVGAIATENKPKEPSRPIKKTKKEEKKKPPEKKPNTKKKKGPNYFEKKHGRCGRCLNKNHIRANCTAEWPQCSICEESHDFYECPQRTKPFWEKTNQSDDRQRANFW